MNDFTPYIESVFQLLQTYPQVFLGISILGICVLFIAVGTNFALHTRCMMAFEFLYEKIYIFFEEILGKDEKSYIKSFIVSLFFIILLANILGLILDFIAPVFGYTQDGTFVMSQYITLPTSSFEFTLALSLCCVLLMLCIEIKSLKPQAFFLKYIPLKGRGYFTVERGNKTQVQYIFAKTGVKIADIFLSFFLAFLDIISLFAKIISLSFRLFGNMTSGTLLQAMVIVGLSSITVYVTQFMGGFEFPILLPIIVVIQGILIACIQAIVFPLLVAIFVRISQLSQ